VFHELRKDRLANVHPLLSKFGAARSACRSDAILGQKKFKSKNFETRVNFRRLTVLAGIQNSCPGQQ
jgi:hypothetical protein